MPSAARPASTSASTSTPTGSSPENGSSRTRTSGLWTRAAASWTRCWLPSDSASTRSPARSATPRRSIQWAAEVSASAAGSRQPVQAGEVLELVPDPHLGVQAALLGHVAEAAAGLGVDRPATPAHLPLVRLQHPEHDPHGGGLPGAVRPDESEHLAFPDGERQVVKGDDVAVAAGQPLELEHLVCPPPSCPPPSPGTLPAGRNGAAVHRQEQRTAYLHGLESTDVHWEMSGRRE